MREVVRGYAASVRDRTGPEDAARAGRALALLGDAVEADVQLLRALAEQEVDAPTRARIVADLLQGSSLAAARLAALAVHVEHGPEVLVALEWLSRRLGEEPGLVEPPAGRIAARERLEGYAAALFEDVPERAVIEEVQDELFRFARMLEGSPRLLSALASPSTPVEVSLGVAGELLEGRATAETVALVRYVLRSGRPHDLVALLDWLVDRAAEDLGRRVAEVRSAVPLDQGQRSRLAAAVGRITGRSVELHERVDPSLIAGLTVVAGDLVIDGSVLRRLEQLRADLPLAATAPDRSHQHHPGDSN